MVEVEQHRAAAIAIIVAQLAHGTGDDSLVARRRELDHLAHLVARLRVAELDQQLPRDPLQHRRVALAERLARGDLEHRARALGEAEQPLLHRRRQRAGAARQGRGPVGEGVDQIALRPGEPVVQRQKGIRPHLGQRCLRRSHQSPDKLGSILRNPPTLPCRRREVPTAKAVQMIQMPLKDLPPDARPREKLLARGAGALSGAELVAVLELARRALAQQLREREVFDSPDAVKNYLRLHLAARGHEVFAVLFLDAQNRLLALEEMFRGTLTQTSVYPREVVLCALRHQAGAVVLAHNHPSGALQPSRADEALTQTLKAALALIDVRVLEWT